MGTNELLLELRHVDHRTAAPMIAADDAGTITAVVLTLVVMFGLFWILDGPADSGSGSPQPPRRDPKHGPKPDRGARSKPGLRGRAEDPPPVETPQGNSASDKRLDSKEANIAYANRESERRGTLDASGVNSATPSKSTAAPPNHRRCPICKDPTHRRLLPEHWIAKSLPITDVPHFCSDIHKDRWLSEECRRLGILNEDEERRRRGEEIQLRELRRMEEEERPNPFEDVDWCGCGDGEYCEVCEGQ